jgi:hypothetical protein
MLVVVSYRQFPTLRTLSMLKLVERPFTSSASCYFVQKSDNPKTASLEEKLNIKRTVENNRNWSKNGTPEIVLGITILVLLGVDQSIQYYQRRQRDQVLRFISDEKNNE